jgi:virginiamycin B lyase
MKRINKFGTIGALLVIGAANVSAQQAAILEHYCATCDLGSISLGSMSSGIGNVMWFCEGQLGTITPAALINVFPKSHCYNIAEGPDDAMWFTSTDDKSPAHSETIGRVSAAGQVTGYGLGLGPDQSTMSITTGPDGALWFTVYQGRIGRITVSGEVTYYPLPNPLSVPIGITTGSDGNLWFGETGNIGRITPAGVITEFPLGDAWYCYGIAPGPDGALWATATNGSSGGAIVRVTTGGAITQYPIPGFSLPYGITAGPNDSVWFTDQNSDRIGSITMSGTISFFPTSRTAYQIATAADGSVWFGEADAIGQVILQTASLAASPATAFPGSSLTLTGSGYAAGETVNLYANSTGAYQLATATADPGGSFSASVKVPELTLFGAEAVVGVGSASGNVAIAPYRVNPLLSVSPATVSAGSSITLSGFGFGPFQSFEVDWNSPPKVRLWGTGITGINGAFYGATAVTLTVPAGASPGANEIVVEWDGSYVGVDITVQ